MRFHDVVDRLGAREGLECIARPLADKVHDTVPPGAVKDALSGTWLGHPLHPMLTDVVIGSWTSALVLDLVGGRRGRPAADGFVVLGLVAAVPTAAAGLADWSDTHGPERRVGVVHAGANVVATVLYAWSLGARARRRRLKGVALGLAGATVSTVGAYLGGHLSFARGVNVNRNAWDHGVEGWTPVADESEVVEGQPCLVTAGDTAVVLVRQGGEVLAVGDRCGHAGGPLHEGRLHDGCITCPWHGSVFRVRDGEVVHGPATVPQPRFAVRVEDGKVMVRSASPGG